MSGKKTPPEVPDHIIESLARCILPAIQRYFESEEGQREFEEWKTEKVKAMHQEIENWNYTNGRTKTF